MPQRQTRTRVTYRPREAAALMNAGIHVQRCPNVFDPAKAAWEFVDTPFTRSILRKLREQEGTRK